MKKYRFIPALALCLLLCGCGAPGQSAQSPSPGYPAAGDNAQASAGLTPPDVSGAFSKRDMKADYDAESAINISLTRDSAVCADSSVSVEGSALTISGEGVYIISGSLQGCITVDAPKTDKVQLVLSGVSVSSPDSAAIYVRQADKVFITLAEGTENSLSNTEGFDSAEDKIDAAVFSRDDLTVNGGGSLAISSPYGHGIAAKDELTITGGSLSVTAAKHALDVNDSIAVCGGSLELSAGKDALHAENEDDTSLGWIYITGGSFSINAGDDGAHASGAVLIDGGSIVINSSYEGIEGKTITISGGSMDITAKDDGLNAADGSAQSNFRGFGGFGGSADCNISISGGSISISADGDGIDSNGSLNISGGDIRIAGANYGDSSIIDYESTASFTGGRLFGTGASTMAENFTGAENGGAIMLNVGNQSTGTLISLTDSVGNVLLSERAERDFSCLLIADGYIQAGESYFLSLDGAVTEISMENAIYGSGGGMPGMGGMHGGGKGGFGGRGGMPGTDQMPDMGEMPDMSELPDMDGMPGMDERPDNGQRPGGDFPSRPRN